MNTLTRYFTQNLLDLYPNMSNGLLEFLVGTLTAESFLLGDDVAISSKGEAVIATHCPKFLELNTLIFPKENDR